MEANTKYSLSGASNPQRQPGYGVWQPLLHGYEYYIMDGLDMLMGRSSLRFPSVGNGGWISCKLPIKAFQKMPILFSLNNDLGYAHESL